MAPVEMATNTLRGEARGFIYEDVSYWGRCRAMNSTSKENVTDLYNNIRNTEEAV